MGRYDNPRAKYDGFCSHCSTAKPVIEYWTPFEPRLQVCDRCKKIDVAVGRVAAVLLLAGVVALTVYYFQLLTRTARELDGWAQSQPSCHCHPAPTPATPSSEACHGR